MTTAPIQTIPEDDLETEYAACLVRRLDANREIKRLFKALAEAQEQADILTARIAAINARRLAKV